MEPEGDGGGAGGGGAAPPSAYDKVCEALEVLDEQGGDSRVREVLERLKRREPRAGDADVPQDLALSEGQIARLRAQRAALLRLSRGLPVPDNLLDATRSSDEDRILYSEAGTTNMEAGEQGEAEEGGAGAGPAGSSMEGGDSTGGKGKLRDAFQVDAGPLPDVGALRREREAMLDSSIRQQAEDLKLLPEGLPHELRVKGLIGSKLMSLLPLQRKLRYSVGVEGRLAVECTPHTLLDWSRMRRNGPDPALLAIQSLASAQPYAQMSASLAATSASAALGIQSAQQSADARARLAAEALRSEEARQKREELDRRRREIAAMVEVVNMRKRFMRDLAALQRDMDTSSREAVKRRRQITQGVTGWHNTERKKLGREARNRLNALKSENIEEYLRMAREAKNDRITTLLGRTDDIVRKLGYLVQAQRALIAENNGDEVVEVVEEPEVEHVNEDDLLAGQRRYNKLVHAVKEQVSRQPRMLTGELRPYQMIGLQWMVSLYNNNLNGILADEMGLGKTIQTCALIAYLAESKHNHGPHLVLAPKAVLPNWRKEFAQWLPDMKVLYYDGKGDERKILREEKMAEGTFNVMLTHYDLVMRDNKFLNKVSWEYLVVDEGHRLKNHQSKLAEVLSAKYKVKHRLLLTGTPIQNALTELWSLLNFLLPTVFNSSQSFDEWFAAPFKGSNDDVALEEEEELLVIHRLQEVIRPFLLRRKKLEVEKDLPEKTQVILKCDMSAWQKLYYKQITEEKSVNVDNQERGTRNLQNSAMQLRKICNHPYLFLEDYMPDDPRELVRASGKFDLLDKMLPKLKASGHRVLLFSQMTRLMDIMEEYLTMVGHKYLRLDGTTKTDERSDLLDKFNEKDSDIFIFLLSTRAGGLGLNLQTADTVILFDSDWNPQADAQAEDRAHRIGQRKEVRVFVMVSVGSIEEDIQARAREKRGIDNKVIQAGMFNAESTAQERRQMLEEIMNRGAHHLGEDIPTDEMMNEMLARTDNEVQLFEQMDEQRYKAEGNRPRLMQPDELPEFTKAAPVEEEKEEELDEETVLDGRRRRKKVVVYTEALTDHMFTKVLEEGGDVTAVAEKSLARKRKKKKSERESHYERLRQMNEDEEEEEEEGEEGGAGEEAAGGGASGSGEKRGRGRPPRKSGSRGNLSDKTDSGATGGGSSRRGGGRRTRGGGRGADDDDDDDDDDDGEEADGGGGGGGGGRKRRRLTKATGGRVSRGGAGGSEEDEDEDEDFEDGEGGSEDAGPRRALPPRRTASRVSFAEKDVEDLEDDDDDDDGGDGDEDGGEGGGGGGGKGDEVVVLDDSDDE